MPTAIPQNVAVGAGDWTNPSNAISSTDFATVTIPAGSPAYAELVLSNFGFNIAESETIDSLTVQFSVSCSNPNGSVVISLIVNGVTVGAMPLTFRTGFSTAPEEQVISINAIPYYVWSDTVDPDSVNDPQFSVIIGFNGTSAAPCDFAINEMRLSANLKYRGVPLMSSNPVLPLSDIVNVAVYVTPQLPAIPSFNLGLIVGDSTSGGVPIIPSWSSIVPARLRIYTSADQMLTDGFTNSSPEYIAAQIYFSQTPTPTQLAVGVQDPTSIAGFDFDVGSFGAGYAVGDVLTVVQSGADFGTVMVDTVSDTGQPLTGHIVTNGTGYSVEDGLDTTGGSGSGAQVQILAVGETPLVAIQNCRAVNSAWWGVMSTTATKEDHKAIALWAGSAAPPCMYFYQTSDLDAENNQAGNIFAYMKANKYGRAFGDWASASTAANNVYAAAALMGYAMGANTGLAGSAFTMFGKSETGITPEPLTETQLQNILGNNGNAYISLANTFNILRDGKVGNGQFLDEVLNLDMLVAAIQFGVMDVLVSNPKVPQTNAGQAMLIDAVNQAAEGARQRGFIAPGVWTGAQVLNLKAGDPVPNGYLAQSPPYSQQSQADRQARKAMPIYLAIVEAGAAQSVLIGVYVQR